MFVKALHIDAWSKHTSREIAYNNILKYLHHMVMVGTKMGMTPLVSSGTPSTTWTQQDTRVDVLYMQLQMYRGLVSLYWNLKIDGCSSKENLFEYFTY